MLPFKQTLLVLLIIFLGTVSAGKRKFIPLESPKNLSLIDINKTEAEISWEPVTTYLNPNNSKICYEIWIWSQNGNQVYQLPFNSTNTFVTFFPFSKNFITVSVRNGKYVGPPSEPLVFDAPQTVPHYPYIFNVYQLSGQSILLRWSKPSLSNGILLGYKIYISDLEQNLNNTIDIKDPNKLQAKINGLKEAATYDISLTSINCAGESERNTISFTLKPHESREPFPSDFIYRLKNRELEKRHRCSKWLTNPTVSTFISTTSKSIIINKDYDYYDYLVIKNDTTRKLSTSSSSEENDSTTTPSSSADNSLCFIDLVITWLPDLENNSGDYFYIRYRIKGHEYFNVTEPEKNFDYLILKEINACKSYEIILTAVDGEFSMDSPMKTTPVMFFINGY